MLFSHRLKVRAFPLSAVTSTCQDVYIQQSHAAKRLLYHYLKRTFDDLLPSYCYAIKTNDKTIRLPVSQPASVGKRANISELQAHHCTKLE